MKIAGTNSQGYILLYNYEETKSTSISISIRFRSPRVISISTVVSAVNIPLTYIHTYIQTRTYLLTYLPTYLPTYLLTYLPTYLPTSLPLYVLILVHIHTIYLYSPYLTLPYLASSWHYRGFSLRSLLMYVVQSGLRMAVAANSTQIIDKHLRLNASNPLYELEIAVLRTYVLDYSMS